MSREAVKILLIDDDPGDAELLRRALAQCNNFAAELHHTLSASDAQRLPDWQDFDLLILDYCLGASTGLQLLMEMRNRGDRRPVIVVTGAGNEYVAAELVRAGVDDYIIKSDITHETLEASIRVARMRADQRLAEANSEAAYMQLAEANLQLAQSSRVDPLTELFNRRAWEESAEQICAAACGLSRPIAIFMIDVDHFKRFNDMYGHSAGDICLKTVASALRESVRGNDVLGRYGGEEFVLITCISSEAELEALGERLRSAVWELEEEHAGNDPFGRVTISIGCAIGSPSDLSLIQEEADRALYEAKNCGRNRCCNLFQEHGTVVE